MDDLKNENELLKQEISKLKEKIKNIPSKKYYEKKKDELNEKRRKYGKDGYSKEYYEKNKDVKKAYAKEYYEQKKK